MIRSMLVRFIFLTFDVRCRSVFVRKCLTRGSRRRVARPEAPSRTSGMYRAQAFTSEPQRPYPTPALVT